MWPLGDRDRTDDLVLGGVEDSHRIVLEEPHIALGAPAAESEPVPAAHPLIRITAHSIIATRFSKVSPPGSIRMSTCANAWAHDSFQNCAN